MSSQNSPSANSLAEAEAALRSAVDAFIGRVEGIVLPLQNIAESIEQQVGEVPAPTPPPQPTPAPVPEPPLEPPPPPAPFSSPSVDTGGVSP